jgi:hypothetical protein
MSRTNGYGLILAGTLALASLGCGSSATSDAGGSGPNCSGGNPLEIYFDPMYSANDGVHTFQIPAIVGGVASEAVAWYSSDPSKVQLTPNPALGGVMITTEGAGTVTITANTGDVCGTAVLTITSNTPDDWDAGYWRYNDGITLDGGQRSLFGGPDGGENTMIQCTTCHGPTADGPYSDVAHTPEQTGGFSDSDLTNIITMGQVPGWTCTGTGRNQTATESGDAGYFDPTIVPYCEWQSFHQWSMTPEQLTGIICYLRSLTPSPQNGTSNFGGHGGFYDGGHGGFPGGGGGDGGGFPQGDGG